MFYFLFPKLSRREHALTCYAYPLRWRWQLDVGETSGGLSKVTLRIFGYLIVGIGSTPMRTSSSFGFFRSRSEKRVRRFLGCKLKIIFLKNVPSSNR